MQELSCVANVASPSPIRHLCSSHPALEIYRAKQEKDVCLVVYLHIPLGIHGFWGKLSSSQQPESKEAVLGFRAHCICWYLSSSFNEALQEQRLQPGCARSSFPAMGAIAAGKAPVHTTALAMLPLPRLLPRSRRWTGMEVADGEYPLEGEETLSGGREGGGLFGGRRGGKCRHLPQH